MGHISARRVLNAILPRRRKEHGIRRGVNREAMEGKWRENGGETKSEKWLTPRF